MVALLLKVAALHAKLQDSYLEVGNVNFNYNIITWEKSLEERFDNAKEI